MTEQFRDSGRNKKPFNHDQDHSGNTYPEEDYNKSNQPGKSTRYYDPEEFEYGYQPSPHSFEPGDRERTPNSYLYHSERVMAESIDNKVPEYSSVKNPNDPELDYTPPSSSVDQSQSNSVYNDYEGSVDGRDDGEQYNYDEQQEGRREVNDRGGRYENNQRNFVNEREVNYHGGQLENEQWKFERDRGLNAKQRGIENDHHGHFINRGFQNEDGTFGGHEKTYEYHRQPYLKRQPRDDSDSYRDDNGSYREENRKLLRTRTMKNAKDIARQFQRLPNENELQYNANNDDHMNEKQPSVVIPGFPMRKCWGRGCTSSDFHSHYINASEFERAKLQDTPVSPATGFSAWDLYRSKAKKKFAKSVKEMTGRFYIWSQAMKTIEGQYGTGVVSYFIFLRWLLLLNIVIFLFVFSFIVLPQSLAALNELDSDSMSIASYYKTSIKSLKSEFTETLHIRDQEGKEITPLSQRGLFRVDDITEEIEQSNHSRSICSRIYEESVKNRTQIGITILQDLLQGTGWLEITAMFPGWYKPVVLNAINNSTTYNMSLAYLFTTLAYFLICLVMMVLYTSESVRESLMTSEGQPNKYCNLLFGGWDYCIEEEKSAKKKHQSIAQELKSSLYEDRQRAKKSKWSREKKIKVYLVRFFLNILVVAILIGAGYLIFHVCQTTVDINKKEMDSSNFVLLLLEFLPSLTITILNILLPIIFTQIVHLEKYSVDFEIKISLMRIVFVRLASIGVLVWTFYNQINCYENRDEECNHCLTKNENSTTSTNVIQCWETYVGQQLYKLVILDFLVVLITTFLFDFPRRLITKTECFRGSKLSNLIGEQEFEIPKHVLDLVYSQTLCWLGTFYSPLLPIVCIIKYIIFFYLKKLTLLVNCVPSKIPYRASRSNTFFMAVLMLSFVLSVIPVGYSIAELSPSRACGPFRWYEDNMWNPVTVAIEASNNYSLEQTLLFFSSAAFAVPVFVILCLAIYFYLTVSAAQKQMIHVLKAQLILEGKDKQFLLKRLTEVAKRSK